jgi:hypothetical protein
MIEREIIQALQTATINAVNASIMPFIPVAYLGRTFEPPNDDRWLEIVHIPNNVIGQFWADGKTYRGLYRLVLHWGMDDAGVYEPLNVLASIMMGFPKGSIFQNGSVSVKIYDEPDLTGLIEASPATLYPVTIRYMTQ